MTGATVTVSGVGSVLSTPAYSVTVPYGWSGTVDVALSGYHFPESPRSYANVTADQAEQDFTPFQPTMSGSTGVAGATVTVSGVGSVVSMPVYSVTVPYGWSGTVEASIADYAFPESPRVYTNVTANQTDQDFSAFQPTISGTVLQQDGIPVADVVVIADNGGGANVTDNNGDYEIVVPYNWSGAIVVNRLGWQIDPNSYSYTQVVADIPEQDYQAVNIGIHVALDGSSDFTSIRDAIAAAENGDEIVIHPGFYTGHTEIYTNKNITVRSIDPDISEITDQTVIYGDPDPYFFLHSNAQSLAVEGLTFEGYWGFNIIVAACNDTLIRNCVFSDIYFLGGGEVISASQCNTTIENCSFLRIKPTGNFGESNLLHLVGSDPSNYSCKIKNCLFAENEISVCSSNDIINSMIYANTDLTIENCTFTNNIFVGDTERANNHIFLVYGRGSGLSVMNSIVWGNITRDCEMLSFAVCEPESSFFADYSDIEGGDQEVFYFPHYGTVVDLWFNGTIPDQNSVPTGVINWGYHNIDANPLFVQIGDDGGDGWVDLPWPQGIDESANNSPGDYHLTQISPCIDAGDFG
ncbi:MAG: hypothetical protein ACYTEU_14310, partial [Planctomycetota bacterium]